MLLGIHADIRPGYKEALALAESLDCEALQIFSYRRHHEPQADELATFGRAFRESPVHRLLVHAHYLPCLAFRDASKREVSVRLLARELRLAQALGARALVVHVGTYSPEGGPEEGIELFCRSLREGWEASSQRVALLVENVPGGGRRLGGSLEDLRAVMEGSPATGVCLDTAHAYAFGYNLAKDMGGFLEKAISLFGKDRIQAFHLNDTLSPLGSHMENHCHWGQGHLARAMEVFPWRDWEGTPAILETPRGEDRRNLEFVRGLFKASR